MKEDSFWTIIKADIQCYKGYAKNRIWRMIKRFYVNESLCVVILFRLIQKSLQLKIPFLPILLKLIYKILSIFLGVWIDSKAKIDKGLYIVHYGGIFIGNIEMGKFCIISHQVTIGIGGRQNTDLEGVPTIGNYVYIAPGAKIFGNIRIGNNVSIGANAVVSKDIPDNAIVVGNPGRIVGYQEKNENIHNLNK